MPPAFEKGVFKEENKVTCSVSNVNNVLSYLRVSHLMSKRPTVTSLIFYAVNEENVVIPHEHHWYSRDTSFPKLSLSPITHIYCSLWMQQWLISINLICFQRFRNPTVFMTHKFSVRMPSEKIWSRGLWSYQWIIN